MELVAKSIYNKVSRIALQRATVVSCSANFATSANTNQVAASTNHTRTRTELDYEELSDLLTFSEDVALIDVRNPQELHTYGSIPGAINIPLGEVKAAFQLSENEFRRTFYVEKPSKTAKNLVFFARGPNASSAALEIAHRLGYKDGGANLRNCSDADMGISFKTILLYIPNWVSRQYSGGWEDYCNKTGLPLKKEKSEFSEERKSPFGGYVASNIYSSYPM
ncbi:Thiosulfate sulfurtransferase/rhodanese-like domain-containing protein 3 [Armadillidium vulgare]|nr:Thiosulfate sulfurtransferase/rhodanese-like domain-containing protein 3 [Armadillidium vulgare]